ncbi:MAG: competence protein CoiA family protein [Bacteroidota bacterium]
MIELEYARNRDKELIHISEVSTGDRGLQCPFCSGELLAKKGLVKQHHFAHVKDSCLALSKPYEPKEWPSHLSLLQYHQWYYQRIENDYNELKDQVSSLREWNSLANEEIEQTVATLKLMSTPLNGKLPKNRELNQKALDALVHYKGNFIELLNTFSRVRFSKIEHYSLIQYPADMRFEKRSTERIYTGSVWQYYDVKDETNRTFGPYIFPGSFEKCLYYLYHYSKNQLELKEKEGSLATLKNLRDQKSLLDEFHLYYIKVSRQGAAPIYKIGITARDMEKRLSEIQSDLKEMNTLDFEVLFVLKGLGHLETFFKHKYQEWQFDYKCFTEYFELTTDQHEIVIKELEQLKYHTSERREKIKKGMARAKANGVHVGRPKGLEKMQRFMAKPKNQEIATLLKSGLKLREVERKTGCSINTVRKVKQALSAN